MVQRWCAAFQGSRSRMKQTAVSYKKYPRLMVNTAYCSQGMQAAALDLVAGQGACCRGPAKCIMAQTCCGVVSCRDHGIS